MGSVKKIAFLALAGFGAYAAYKKFIAKTAV